MIQYWIYHHRYPRILSIEGLRLHAGYRYLGILSIHALSVYTQICAKCIPGYLVYMDRGYTQLRAEYIPGIIPGTHRILSIEGIYGTVQVHVMHPRILSIEGI